MMKLCIFLLDLRKVKKALQDGAQGQQALVSAPCPETCIDGDDAIKYSNAANSTKQTKLSSSSSFQDIPAIPLPIPLPAQVNFPIEDKKSKSKKENNPDREENETTEGSLNAIECNLSFVSSSDDTKESCSDAGLETVSRNVLNSRSTPINSNRAKADDIVLVDPLQLSRGSPLLSTAEVTGSPIAGGTNLTAVLAAGIALNQWPQTPN